MPLQTIIKRVHRPIELGDHTHLANANSCEAAHISSVAKSKCNHPHNLLWLCANHHTKFDNGSYGAKEELNEFVIGKKIVLRERRRLNWATAGNLASSIATLLKLAGETVKAKKRTNPLDKDIALQIATGLLTLLPEVLSRNMDPRLAPVLAKISASLESGDVSGFVTEAKSFEVLKEVAAFESEFVSEAGLKPCPLCDGSRWHRDEECPVCMGDGTVPEKFVFDPSLFEAQQCNVCLGRPSSDGEDCPACGGQGDLDAYRHAAVDWAKFDEVPCKLCSGTRMHLGDDCPACGGNGKMYAYREEQIDWSSFDKVTCQLCSGSGRRDGEDCPACDGEGKLKGFVASGTDWSRFDKVTCRLCSGTRRHDGDDCVACGGHGELDAWYDDQVDWRGLGVR